MLLPTLVLLSGLSISCVAAFFSIIGLTKMFPEAFWPIVTMGTVLEIGKLASACWLHHNWKRAPWTMKIYMTLAVVVLIFITSMGIFGYLSKSHIEHSKLAEKNTAMTEKIKEEDKTKTSGANNAELIVTEKAKIDELQASLDKSIEYDISEIARLNTRLTTLNEAVKLVESQPGGLFSSKKKKIEALKEEQKAERSEVSGKINAAEGRIQKIRNDYAGKIEVVRDRIDALSVVKDNTSSLDKIEDYNENIRNSNSKIRDLEIKRFDYKDDQLEMDAEIGPVKYVAELFEDFGGDKVEIEEAVRIIILVLIFVFDPLAVAMLLAANFTFMSALEKRPITVKEDPPPSNDPPTPPRIPSPPPPSPEPEPEPPPPPEPEPEPEVEEDWKNDIYKEEKKIVAKNQEGITGSNILSF